MMSSKTISLYAFCLVLLRTFLVCFHFFRPLKIGFHAFELISVGLTNLSKIVKNQTFFFKKIRTTEAHMFAHIELQNSALRKF